MLLRVDLVFASGSAEGHTYAHPHPADLVPAAHFFCRALRFQVKINNIPHPLRHCDCTVTAAPVEENRPGDAPGGSAAIGRVSQRETKSYGSDPGQNCAAA